MDRRKFLRLIPVVVAAGVIAPKLLIPKEPVRLTSLQIVEPIKWLNRLPAVRDDYFIGCDPVIPKRVYTVFTGSDGIKQFHEAMRECHIQYTMSIMKFQSHIK